MIQILQVLNKLFKLLKLDYEKQENFSLFSCNDYIRMTIHKGKGNEWHARKKKKTKLPRIWAMPLTKNNTAQQYLLTA